VSCPSKCQSELRDPWMVGDKEHTTRPWRVFDVAMRIVRCSRTHVRGIPRDPDVADDIVIDDAHQVTARSCLREMLDHCSQPWIAYLLVAFTTHDNCSQQATTRFSQVLKLIKQAAHCLLQCSSFLCSCTTLLVTARAFWGELKHGLIKFCHANATFGQNMLHTKCH
jgi:hypothetical protein